MIKYVYIGLNLFCKQFREPEKIINDAAELAKNMGVPEEELILEVKENTENFFNISLT